MASRLFYRRLNSTLTWLSLVAVVGLLAVVLLRLTASPPDNVPTREDMDPTAEGIRGAKKAAGLSAEDVRELEQAAALRARIERLEREYGQASGAKDWPRAIDAGLELNKLVPNDKRHQYNLACAYARNAEPDQAAEWLGKAAADGFSLLRWFETDPDLETVRSHPGYQAALSVVKSNRGEELADLQERFEQKPMRVILPPQYDATQPAPLIVVLHGKGGRAGWVTNQWRKVAAEIGAIIIAPQAVHPFGGGFSWAAKDTNYSLGDDAEFLVRLTVEFASNNYQIDWKRAVLTGFSEGGGVCRWVGPRPPYNFVGVIPMGCDYLREYDEPPKAIGDRPPRFYFMAGELDHAAPADQLHLAAKDYNAAGFQTQVRIYPDVGHNFPIKRDEELRKALDFVLQR